MMKYAFVFATVLAAGLALPLERDADVPVFPPALNKTDSLNATVEPFTGTTMGATTFATFATFTTALPTAAVSVADVTPKAEEKAPMKLTMTRDISKDKAVVKDEINSLDTSAAGNTQGQDQKRDINTGMNSADNKNNMGDQKRDLNSGMNTDNKNNMADQKRDLNAGMGANTNNMAANENRQARQTGDSQKPMPPKITMTREVGKDKAVVKDELTNVKENEMTN